MWALALAVLLDAEAADDVALRPLPKVLVAPSLEVPEELSRELGTLAAKACAEVWPSRYAAGEASTAGPVSDIRGPLVHVGVKLTRLELRQVHLPGAKTITTSRATLSAFAVDLGTGEVLASSPRSFVRSVEQADGITPIEPWSVATASLREAVPDVVRRLGARFEPGRIEATVIDVDGEELWARHGERDGAFVGERFRDPDGDVVEVIAVGDDVSRLALVIGSDPAKVGDVLVRFGRGGKVGVPRVLVAPAVGSMPEGVDPAQVATWVGDAFTDAGWILVPSGRELVDAQLYESAVGSVPSERLINTQALPDVVAVPHLWDQSVDTATDEAGGGAVHGEASLQIDLVDATSGVLVGALRASHEQTEPTRATLVSAFAADLASSTVKDAASALTTAEGIAPPARRPAVPVAEGGATGPSWSTRDGLVAEGALGEVRRPTRRFPDPAGGPDWTGPETLIGIARAQAPEGNTQRAQWVANQGAVRSGDLYHPLSDAPGSAPMRVVVAAPRGDLVDARTSEAALLGFLAGDGARVVAEGFDASSLRAVQTLVESGGFVGGLEQEAVAPRLEARCDFEVTVTEEDRGGTVLQVLTAVGRAKVVDLTTGTVVALRAPSAKSAVETYAMSKSIQREFRVRPGQRALGLSEDATRSAVRRLVHDTARELGRRVVVMTAGAT